MKNTFLSFCFVILSFTLFSPKKIEANSCSVQEELNFLSGAKIQVCQSMGRRSGFGSVTTFSFSEDDIMKVSGKRVELNLRNAKGEFYSVGPKLRQGHNTVKYNEVFVIEFANDGIADLPIRLHGIDCSEKICKKSFEWCAYSESFTLAPELVKSLALYRGPTTGNAWEQRKTVETIVDELNQNQCKVKKFPEDDFYKNQLFLIMQFYALAGNKNCQNELLKYEGNWKPNLNADERERLFEQIRFVQKGCFPTESPKLLTLKSGRGSSIKNIKSTPMVFNMNPDDLRPILIKKNGLWSNFWQDSGFDEIFEEKHLIFPSIADVYRKNIFEVPLELKTEMNILNDGRVVGSVIAGHLMNHRRRGAHVDYSFVDKSNSNKLYDLYAKSDNQFVGNKVKSDHAKWERKSVTKKIEGKVKRKFIESFKKKLKCTNSDYEYDLVDTKKPLTESDVKIDSRVFRSESGDAIVGARVNMEYCPIDSYDNPYSDVSWYWVPKNSDPKWIIHTLRQDGPLGAGDFDGDGQVEWIFGEDERRGFIYYMISDKFTRNNGVLIRESSNWKWWLKKEE